MVRLVSLTPRGFGGRRRGSVAAAAYCRVVNHAILACQDRADPYAKPIAARQAQNQTGSVMSMPAQAVPICIRLAATPNAAEIKYRSTVAVERGSARRISSTRLA